MNKSFILLGVWAAFMIFSMHTQGGAQSNDAQVYYKAGVKFFQNGHFDEASQQFRMAYKLKPSWKIYYNIGQSEAAAKRYGLALDAFESYLTQGGDEVLDDRRDEVLSELDRLRKIVGSLDISVPDGAEIYIDGMLRGTAPLLGKLAVSAAVPHTIYAIIDGETTPSKKFKVRGTETLEISLGESEQPPETEEQLNNINDVAEDTDENALVDEQADGSGTEKALLIPGGILMGAGAGTLIAGLVTGIKTRSLDNEIVQQCPQLPCSSVLDGKIKELDTLQRTTNLLLIAGGVVAAAGTALFVVGLVLRKKGRGNDELNTGQIWIHPAVDRGFAGLQIQGSF